MEKNKTGKYLKYAIGEIILVVFGILIALSINNWNEVRKLDNEEHNLLIALKEEINNNIAYVHSEIESNSIKVEQIAEFIKLFTPENGLVTEEEIAVKLRSALLSNPYFQPAEGVIKEMMNSGKLSLIKNSKLRGQLSLWESKLVPLRQQEQLIIRKHELCFDYALNHGDFRRMREITEKDKNTWYAMLGQNKFKNTSNKHLIQSKEYENHLVYYMGGTYYLNGFYETFKNYMVNIQQLIDTELLNR